jgi:hypothetical protein
MTRGLTYAVLFVLAVAALAGGLLASTSRSGSRAAPSAGRHTVVARDFRTAEAARSHLHRTLDELNRQHSRQLAGFCPLELPGSVELSYADARNNRTTVLLATDGNHVYRISRQDPISTPAAKSHELLLGSAAQLIGQD